MIKGVLNGRKGSTHEFNTCTQKKAASIHHRQCVKGMGHFSQSLLFKNKYTTFSDFKLEMVKDKVLLIAVNEFYHRNQKNFLRLTGDDF